MMERLLRPDEVNFLRKMLIENNESDSLVSQLKHIFVEEMPDGCMGSLRFKSSRKNRSLGRDVGRIEFLDADGVNGIATLSLDNFGDLYELDVWKVDFSNLKKFPVLPT